MIRILLIRGMLAGFLAGIAAFGFARLYGEPQVDRAIAFEKSLDHTAHTDHHPLSSGVPAAADSPGTDDGEEPELVSRTVQAGWGLFTGVTVYGAAFGGLFSLVYAAAYGRIGGLGPRGLSALLAGAGFAAVGFIPGLAYPPNPPAIGLPETIAQRTALYFEFLLISLTAMTLAVMIGRHLASRWGQWNSNLAGAALYAAVTATAAAVLPATREIPEHFPAELLWHFRLASFGTQAVLWLAIGLIFGWLAERSLRHPPAP